MDEIARYNIRRWQALVNADAPYTRPALDLDEAAARRHVDSEGLLGDVTGKRVLCLAAGGGRQSAAFALLGAHVTVFDLSESQLERDRQAAAHYGLTITTIQGDMRDLSPLAPASFDIVHHGYSLGFVPDAQEVFAQVARVLKPGGIYFLTYGNPFYGGLSPADWNGEGYSLKLPYIDGAPVTVPDPEWVYSQSHPDNIPDIRETREFRHTFGATINGLLSIGFRLLRVSDSAGFTGDNHAAGGTWDHFVSVAPPWLEYWLRYEPGEG